LAKSGTENSFVAESLVSSSQPQRQKRVRKSTAATLITLFIF